MLRSISIGGFRGFESFEMRDLGRVNLLVGTNNSGKTSVLEAIQLLMAGHAHSIWSILSRRGERLVDDLEIGRPRRAEADVCHLFRGHAIEIGSEFRIKGVNDATAGSLTATIQERSLDDDSQKALFEEDDDYASFFGLLLKGGGFAQIDENLPLSIRGGLSSDILRKLRSATNAAASTRFITTASLSSDDVVSMYEYLVLTPEEDLVIEALKTLEPAIERLATRSKEPRLYRGYPGERGGIVVRCTGVDQPVPIGSLGDGIWRMLGLTLALVHAKNGVLLIDEIDTGLHFSVMSDMWKLVSKTAKRLNVQVFATTHSRDAVESLAAISRSGNDVTIQRLERDKHRAVAFTEQQIVIAAERGIEVR